MCSLVDDVQYFLCFSFTQTTIFHRILVDNLISKWQVLFAANVPIYQNVCLNSKD